MTIDNINFINSVQRTLSEFIMTKMKDKFNEDVYVAFDYNDVKLVFSDQYEDRVTFHLARLPTTESSYSNVGDNTEGQKVGFEFRIYTVVNQEVKPTHIIHIIKYIL